MREQLQPERDLADTLDMFLEMEKIQDIGWWFLSLSPPACPHSGGDESDSKTPAPRASGLNWAKAQPFMCPCQFKKLKSKYLSSCHTMM